MTKRIKIQHESYANLQDIQEIWLIGILLSNINHPRTSCSIWQHLQFINQPLMFYLLHVYQAYISSIYYLYLLRVNLSTLVRLLICNLGDEVLSHKNSLSIFKGKVAYIDLSHTLHWQDSVGYYLYLFLRFATSKFLDMHMNICLFLSVPKYPNIQMYVEVFYFPMLVVQSVLFSSF